VTFLRRKEVDRVIVELFVHIQRNPGVGDGLKATSGDDSVDDSAVLHHPHRQCRVLKWCATDLRSHGRLKGRATKRRSVCLEYTSILEGRVDCRLDGREWTSAKESLWLPGVTADGCALDKASKQAALKPEFTERDE
jgi:hypothetical protein